MISFFHQPDFSLRNFHNFRKKRQKNVVFLRLPPRRHLFQFFFRVSCNMSLGAISRVRVFIRKNDPFFNFCPFLTMSPRRRCNLTRNLACCVCWTEKKLIKKSFLNLHFKGFGAINRSDSNRVLKTEYF